MLRHSFDKHRWLRLFEETDAEALYAVVVANRGYLAEWMPWAPGQTLENTLEFIRMGRRQIAENDGCQLAIVHDGAIVGSIGYHRVDWRNRVTSIGYWIAEDAQGRGSVTQAASALAENAFGPWKLNRVEIEVSTGNARSRRIPERLGFVQEGIRRELEVVGERRLDHVMYAMLAADWPAAAR